MNLDKQIFQDALAALNARDLDSAERLFRKLIEIQPGHVAALNFLTVVLMSQERFAEAEVLIKKAVELSPNSDVSFYNYGIILKRLGKPKQAKLQFDKALHLNSKVHETWNNRGTVFNDLKQHEEAIADFDQALLLHPNYPEAYCNKGKSLTALSRYDDAVAAYDRALALKPDLAEAWFGRGDVLTALNRYEDSIAAYDQALALKPDLAEAWLCRGVVFAELKRCDEALSSFDKALALKPDVAEAWLGRGNVLTALNRYEDSIAAYDRALALKSDLTGVKGARLYSKLRLCDWSNFTAECEHLISSVRKNEASTAPSILIMTSASPEDQLKCARLWVSKNHARFDNPLWRNEVYKHNKIRIGYVSGDFHQHPVSYLTAGMFECHDKSRFEVIGISLGPDDSSETRRRLQSAFTQFIDARTFSDSEMATFIRNREIDILVDLAGFTSGQRTGIFSRRPAPIQINYLGYPATMGTDYFDYVIADEFVIPDIQQRFYSEKIIYLPDTFQANDSKRKIHDTPASRAEVGLPESAFVFCSLNYSYKINPTCFDIWMRLLHRIDGSVIWLLGGNDRLESNLRKEAENRGVNPNRLIFAPRIAYANHLARFRLADLFLDTFPFNAGATASDALWAGLPIITRSGETFASRMAGSLLRAIGLPEMITGSASAYEDLACELARNPSLIAKTKMKLATNVVHFPLFNTSVFTRHIEKAFQIIYERYRAGLPPGNIYVPR